MSDSRMVKALPNKVALTEHEVWEKNNSHRLDVYREILRAQIEAAIRSGDQEGAFSDANALAVQAHRAGFREGLRSALALLQPRS